MNLNCFILFWNIIILIHCFNMVLLDDSIEVWDFIMLYFYFFNLAFYEQYIKPSLCTHKVFCVIVVYCKTACCTKIKLQLDTATRFAINLLQNKFIVQRVVTKLNVNVNKKQRILKNTIASVHLTIALLVINNYATI